MEKLKKIFFQNLTTRQIIFKNTIWLYLSEALSKGLRLLIFILIIRILGPENFGIFEYLLSFIGIFFLFADFGTSNIFIRDYQQDEDKEKHINAFFWVKFLLSITFSLLAILGYAFAKKFDGFLFYLLFVIFYFISNLEGFFESFFIAVEKTERKFLFNTLMSLCLFIFVFFGLLIYPQISVVIAAYILSALVGLGFAYFLFRKETKLKIYFDFSLIKYYLFNGLPLALFGLLGYVFFTTDKIILAHLRPIEEVGYYSLASRILAVLFVVPALFNTALYPYLARKVSEKHTFSKSLFLMIVIGSMIAGLISAGFIFLFSPILVPLFFGAKYLMSISILQSFVWISVFVFPTIFLDYFLISNHKQWLDFGITLLPAILNIILNFIFIPQFGAFGAVYASIISQFINFALTLTTSIFVLKGLNFLKTG
jgi:O-antigen/teichoic acid export membrane protein